MDRNPDKERTQQEVLIELEQLELKLNNLPQDEKTQRDLDRYFTFAHEQLTYLSSSVDEILGYIATANRTNRPAGIRIRMRHPLEIRPEDALNWLKPWPKPLKHLKP